MRSIQYRSLRKLLQQRAKIVDQVPSLSPSPPHFKENPKFRLFWDKHFLDKYSQIKYSTIFRSLTVIQIETITRAFLAQRAPGGVYTSKDEESFINIHAFGIGNLKFLDERCFLQTFLITQILLKILMKTFVIFRENSYSQFW